MTGKPAKPRDRRIHWRCFHCDETFTRAQAPLAREHFGADQDQTPVCKMRVPGEGSLLTALREAHDELYRYRTEDADVIRAMIALQGDHARRLQCAEQTGYGTALADVEAGKVEPELARRIIAALTPIATD